MKYVKAIGLEIEGGWFSIEDKPRSGGHWHADQSVRNIRLSQNGRSIGFVGEVSSSPLTSLKQVKNWIDTFWPDRKNDSCGFHIHTSFENNHYAYLVDEKFYIEFFHAMEVIGRKLDLCSEYFSRLNGQNHHCQKLFKGFEQVEARSKTNDRYTQLNFCHALHGTLENRLPPAMLPIGKAYSYTEEYVKFIEDYLDKHPKPSKTNFSWESSFSVED